MNLSLNSEHTHRKQAMQSAECRQAGPLHWLPACTACCSSYTNCVLPTVTTSNARHVLYSAECRQPVHLQLHLFALLAGVRLHSIITHVVLPAVTASRPYTVWTSSLFAIVCLPALLAAVRFDSMATSVILPTVTARMFSLPSNCSEMSYLNLCLSLWAKVAHNLSFIIAFILCSNLGVLSTLRLSRNEHSLPPYSPSSLCFSLTPPTPKIQKCLAFSEHLTLSDTVQGPVLQRSCCEKLMITRLVYIPPTTVPPLPSTNTRTKQKKETNSENDSDTHNRAISII